MQKKPKQISWQFMQKDYIGDVTVSDQTPVSYRIVYKKPTALDNEKDIVIFRNTALPPYAWEQRLEKTQDEAENVRFVQAVGAALEAAGLND